MVIVMVIVMVVVMVIVMVIVMVVIVNECFFRSVSLSSNDHEYNFTCLAS
jgi:flagellar basal body-associated protein FliL